MEGKVLDLRPGGLIFRRNLKNLTPIYGKYCGEAWTEGRDASYPNDKPINDKTPEDSLDVICQKHDYCYDRRSEVYCDKTLLNDVVSIGLDPTKWPKQPKSPEEAELAKTYAKLMLHIFKIKVWWAELGDLELPNPIIPGS